ncbi:MAG: lasso peptide biosynthesis B2 protein [Steroidobacter sp.]
MSEGPRQYWIPSHVRACSTGAATVLLDLKRNRYFGVGARETRALLALAGNWSKVNAQTSGAIEPMAPEEAAEIAEALVHAGLLSRVADGDAPAAEVIDLDGLLRSAGHELQRCAPIRFTHVVNFVRACVWARRSLRARSLYSVVCKITHRKTCAGGCFDEHRAIELVTIFRRLRPYTFTARDHCLFHALVLVDFLSRYEVFPMWVIGVRIRPWAAHSWVQQGSLILDGNPEHICEYTPILAA